MARTRNKFDSDLKTNLYTKGIAATKQFTATEAPPKKSHRKIRYYLALTLLTAGASLMLGFLSFGGMYVLMPVLPLAFATFGLSSAYEGEVYLQNIKEAFKKLFKTHYLKNHLAKEYLLKKFPDINKTDCPQFFKDYAEQLKLLSAFKHKHLNKDSKKRKKQIEKTLTDMEKWFARQLFSTQKGTKPQSIYTQELRDWLSKNEQNEWQALLEKRQSAFNKVKAFSILSALFMALGSTYLIVEAFTIIPIIAAIPFAFWPFMIVPMAVIAGAAYGMLTYNAVTDLINKDTVNKWYTKIRDDLKQGHIFMPVAAAFLFVIAAVLTVCTAGTWWTVATHARPLFEWMRKMPGFVMGVINPLITGLSTVMFNSQNIAESLELVDKAAHSDTNSIQRTYKAITEGFAHVRATENWFQILNPFRFLLKVTITPLRILLFLGHLVSIAMTSDRMPGVPQIISVLVAIISEGFEDAHRFVGHNDLPLSKPVKEGEMQDIKPLLEARLEDNQDSNEEDIPTRILKALALPFYALAASWDFLTSKINAKDTQRKVLTFSQAWNKQLGIEEEVDVPLPATAKHPSKEWQVEHTVFLLDKKREHLKSVWIGSELADEKRVKLKRLKNRVRTAASNGESLNEVLSEAKKTPVYNQHRWFSVCEGETTATQEFIERLPGRVNVI